MVIEVGEEVNDWTVVEELLPRARQANGQTQNRDGKDSETVVNCWSGFPKDKTKTREGRRSDDDGPFPFKCPP